MSEWLKERAWKVRIPQKGIVGSNPAFSAKKFFAQAGEKISFVSPAQRSRTVAAIATVECTGCDTGRENVDDEKLKTKNCIKRKLKSNKSN